MSVLVMMRVKVHKFEGTEQAVIKHGDVMRKSGCHWFKVYRGMEMTREPSKRAAVIFRKILST